MAISTGTAILSGMLGSAVIGGVTANQQAGAIKDTSAASLAEQARQFDAMMARSEPFHEGSLKAYNSLLEMEGLGGMPAAPAPVPERPSITAMPRPAYNNQLPGAAPPQGQSSFLAGRLNPRRHTV